VQVAVFGTARSPHFSQAIITVTVQLWIQVFWVISVYLNIRNILPKSGTFLLGHPVYILVAGISLWAVGLNDRPIYVIFVIDKVTLGEFSAKYSDIPLLASFH